MNRDTIADTSESSPQVSVVVPVYDEEENLQTLYEELIAALEPEKWSFEIVMIDDRSRDNSFALLKEIAEKDPRCRAFRLTRNMGQTQAIAAGLSKISGEIVVLLDADLQNPPAAIPDLIRELEQGWGAVSGWRKYRKDGLVFRRFPSVCANYIISKLMGFRIHDYGCSLKAYRKIYLDGIQMVGDTHRLLLAYAVINGASVKEVEVPHRPRLAGRSKYGMGRVFKVVLDLAMLRFTSAYSTKPSHFFSLFGLAMATLSMLILAFVTGRWWWYGGVWISPLLIIGLTAFFTGFQIIVLGIAVDVIYRAILSSSDRETFALDES